MSRSTTNERSAPRLSNYLLVLARRTRAERNFERTLAALVLANDPEWCRQNARLIDVVRRGAIRPPRHGESDE